MRMWTTSRARILWGWRFHSLGSRSFVGKCRDVPSPKSISIGHHTSLLDDWCLVDLSPAISAGLPKIRIGSYCNILHDFQCNAGLSVEIQDYVLIAPRVFITDSDHIVEENAEKSTQWTRFSSAPVVIEHNCWLGVNTVVLKGVRIGHHSVVGANAVVTRDVPPLSTVVGVPGKVLAGRNSIVTNVR